MVAVVIGSSQLSQSVIDGKAAADLREILICYVDMLEKLHFKVQKCGHKSHSKIGGHLEDQDLQDHILYLKLT